MHGRRTFCVYPVETADELAEKLTAHTWTLCTAFRLLDYLFLNDSTSEDGAQEYAVVRAPTDDGPAVQVESITFGWCDRAKAADYIRRTLAGEIDADARPLTMRLEPPATHGRCGHCA
ncbi:MAG: hypothetical protein U0871_15485 [Gemmataceae bacterium]